MAAEQDDDMERIAGAVDADGDQVPQDHPIENPGEDDDDAGEPDDPIAEPHPDEPGAPSEADDVADSV